MYFLLLFLLTSITLYSSETPEQVFFDYELIKATHHGAFDVVEKLIELGANPNCTYIEVKGDEPLTPLQIANNMGHTDIATLLISHGAELPAQTQEKDTPSAGNE